MASYFKPRYFDTEQEAQAALDAYCDKNWSYVFRGRVEKERIKNPLEARRYIVILPQGHCLMAD
jgi:hypothetical protein